MYVSIDWDQRTFYVYADRASGNEARLRGSVDFPQQFPFQIRGFFPMSLVLSVTQRVALAIQPVDAHGNPAPVDGAPVWEVSDPSIVSLGVAEDGLSAFVRATGAPGHVQVRVTADARLTEEVREISGVLEIDIVPAEAVALSIVAGEPVEVE